MLRRPAHHEVTLHMVNHVQRTLTASGLRVKKQQQQQQQQQQVSLLPNCQRFRHTLPALSYPVSGGCLPCFSAKTLTHHYNKHHSFYVERLNTLTTNTPFYNAPIEHIITQTAFDSAKIHIYQNACQHFNHSFFWKCVKPSGSALSKNSQLYDKIGEQWGSIEEFKKQFSEQALNLFGSGWVWLVINNNKELSIWVGKDADSPIALELVPLLALDVWEHAYYMDHKNDRKSYVDSFWNVVNWTFVSQWYDNVVAVLNERL
jgi:Fe-Mn family superoxide dismutase